MGRTLHYKITKLDGKPFTMDEHKVIFNLSKRYNNGEMEKVWTCENFFPSPFGSYCPNWQNRDLKFFPPEVVEKMVANAIDSAKGRDRFERIQSVSKKGWIHMFHDFKEPTLGGFTKTQGNELNSLLVLTGLVELSELLPVNITLDDEGRFLYGPIMIQKGRAIPMIGEMREHFRNLASRLVLAGGYRGNVLKKLKVDGLGEHMRSNILKIGNPYGGCTINYMQDTINDLAHIEKVLAKRGITGYEIDRLEERPVRQWLPVNLLHRSVNPADYLDYKMSAATLMDGFNGEGFGLADDTAEASSYRAIGLIQSLLGFTGMKGAHLQVLGVKEPVEVKPKKKRAPRKKKPATTDAGNWAINHLAEG